MAGRQRKKYRPWAPAEFASHPYTAADRLPEDDLVFFLLDVIPQLDLAPFYASYEGPLLAKVFLWSACRQQEVAGLRWPSLRRVGDEVHFEVVGRCGVERW